MPLGIDFWVDVGWFWLPKWNQVGTKMGTKINVNFERRFFQKTIFFWRKNNVFWDQISPSWEQKSIKNRSKNGVKDGICYGRRGPMLQFPQFALQLGPGSSFPDRYKRWPPPRHVRALWRRERRATSKNNRLSAAELPRDDLRNRACCSAMLSSIAVRISSYHGTAQLPLKREGANVHHSKGWLLKMGALTH